MAVIAVSNPKGGAGKSTSALLLATYLAEHGASVCAIDADPRQPLVRWKNQGKTQCPLDVVGGVKEKTLADVVAEQRANYQFVFIDLEGTASLMVSRSIALASLVIIPVQASPEDVWAAEDAVALVKAEEQILRYSAPTKCIPFRILLTRTSAPGAPVTGIQRDLLREVSEAGRPMFRNSIAERQAFKAAFLEGMTLSEIDKKGVKVGNLAAALLNVHDVAEELLDILEGKDRAVEEIRKAEVA